MRIMQRSYFGRLKVTHCNENYEGSCTIPKSIMAKNDVRFFEKVFVDNVTKGKVHLETYAIEGIENRLYLNGAMAQGNDVGDEVDIYTEELCFEAR
jgi:aspartate 1-decarboxylase